MILDLDTGVDVADAEIMAEFVRSSQPITRLAHVAGVVGSRRIDELAPSEWERVIRHNLTSAYAVTRAIVPRMAEHGGGAQWC